MADEGIKLKEKAPESIVWRSAVRGANRMFVTVIAAASRHRRVLAWRLVAISFWMAAFAFMPLEARAAQTTSAPLASNAMAPQITAEPPPPVYVEVILSNNRRCKRCRLEWVDDANIRLTNPAGVSAIYPAREVMGVDKHPKWRRFMLKGIYGQGLAGRVIVPSAYDQRHPDWEDPKF
jgi:hypothetical protein